MNERERDYWETFLESANLDQTDLYGLAASSAAIELVENWKDSWNDGYADGVSSWQEMMVADISNTIKRLQSWKNAIDASSEDDRSSLPRRQVDESVVLSELQSLEEQHSHLLDLFKKVYHHIQREELAGHFSTNTISELEKLFPYNPNTNTLAQRSCPSCGSFESFNISGKVWMTVTDDGVNEYVHPEWDDDSVVRCTRCKWRGTWKDLED